MSIEIRNLSIKSNVVQRQAFGAGEGDAESPDQQQPTDDDWRAECRRMIVELLDERRER
jgi:hypothetical protein